MAGAEGLAVREALPAPARVGLSVVEALTVRDLAEVVRPVALAGEQLLPVLPPLAQVLPEGALRRGTVAEVVGDAAASTALALLAGPSAAGSWIAVVGLPGLGMAAAAQLGVVLERTVLVHRPPPGSWAQVLAALVDSFDLLLLPADGLPSRSSEARRLSARVRERGAVLVGLGSGSRLGDAPDVWIRAETASWEGLGDGHGHLRSRLVSMEVGGRRGASRLRRSQLWLPGPGGQGVLVA